MYGSLPGLDASTNIHPVFIHFPIALWFSALAFCMVALVFKKDHLWQVGRWLLNLGLLGALFAVGTGLGAENRLGHDSPGHELVHLHRNLMLVATGIAALTALLAQAWRGSSNRGVRVVTLVLMMATAAITTFGADQGALVSIRHAGHDHAAEEGHHEPAEADAAAPESNSKEHLDHGHTHASPESEKAGKEAAPREHPAKKESPSAKHSHDSAKKDASDGHEHHQHSLPRYDELDDEGLSYE